MSIIKNDTTRTVILRAEEILDETLAPALRVRAGFQALARSAARVALSHRIERADGTFDYPKEIIIRVPSNDWDDNPGKWGPQASADTEARVQDLIRGRGDLTARGPYITFEPDPTITRAHAGRPNPASPTYKGTAVGGQIHDTVGKATFPHLLLESNGQRIPLLSHHESLTVGRATTGKSRINDQSVSRHHFHATLDTNATVRVSDADSLGGTWVNGARLDQGATAILQDGDTFAAADVPIRVVIPGAPPRRRSEPTSVTEHDNASPDDTEEFHEVNQKLAEEIDAAWTILDDHGTVEDIARKTGVFRDLLDTSRSVRDQINAGELVPPTLVLKAVLACREAILQVER